MRIELKKGKQRELLNKIKNNNHFTWREFSKFLQVSQIALIGWYREENLLPLEIYKRLDRNNEYKPYISEVKEDNWGRSKGGLNSRGSLKEITLPTKSKELAELIGIILGDGNLFSYKQGKKIGVYSLKIAGDYKNDEHYHINYIKPICEGLFNLRAKIQNIPKNNERFVSLYSKQLVNYLVSIGLKAGDKIKNQVTIPKWVSQNKSFLKSCLRGLVDTDGSIFRMSKKDPHLIRINFTNHNKTLLQDTRLAFIKLGFHPSNIINNKQFNLSRKEDIVRYINQIGFSNKKHRQRFDQFSSPVV